MKDKKLCLVAEESVKVHPELRRYFSYCLYKSAVKLRSQIDKEFRQLGYMAPQLGMLKLLDILGPRSQIQLGADMGIDKASMVKLLDILEDKKLVKRVPSQEDRRVKLIQLSPAGLRELKKLSLIREKIETLFLKHLSEKDRKDLLRLVPKLLE